MKAHGFGLTDVGSVRDHNEDSFIVDNEHALYIVCDGVGGRSAGEVASHMGVEIIRDHMHQYRDSLDVFVGEPDDTLSKLSNRLGSAIRLANSIVYESANSKPNLLGMGSTVVALAVEGKTATIAHAGDSRAYLVRGGKVTQLTDDHSLVTEQLQKGLITEAEARTSNIKNVITRALGPEKDINVEIAEHKLEDGDKFVLCSDGLSNLVPREEILSSIVDSDGLDKACANLIKLANERGGDDNITVVIVETGTEGILGFFKKLSV